MFADLYPETLSEVTGGGRVGHTLGRFFMFYIPINTLMITEVVSTLLIYERKMSP